MADRYVVVIDAGTSGVRCVLFNEKAQAVGLDEFGWKYSQEDDASTLARAFDLSALWEDLCRSIKSCIKRSQVRTNLIRAISVTCQRQAIVFLDADGNDVYAGPNLDLRAVFEGAAIDGELAEVVYRTTGHLPSLLFAPAKLRWFQRHRPNAYGRISSVLTLADWLVWKLTGVRANETTLAGEAGLLDINQRDWCEVLFEKIGVECGTAPLLEPGSVAGHLSVEAASETGLIKTTPVICAGADTQCGLLGMGVSQERQVGIVAGWSAPLQMVTSRPVLSSEARTWAGLFPVGGGWVLESSAGDIGDSYRWIGETICGGGDNVYQRMERLACAVPAGSDGAQAFMGTPSMNMSRVGMRSGGLLFPVPVSHGQCGLANLIRASLECMAYAIRGNLEQIEALSGTRASIVALGGGMTRTLEFTRIVANVLGRELRISPVANVSAVGAYLCAVTALGEFESLEQATSGMHPRLGTLEPEPLSAAEYEDHYRRWTESSAILKSVNL